MCSRSSTLFSLVVHTHKHTHNELNALFAFFFSLNLMCCSHCIFSCYSIFFVVISLNHGAFFTYSSNSAKRDSHELKLTNITNDLTVFLIRFFLSFFLSLYLFGYFHSVCAQIQIRMNQKNSFCIWIVEKTNCWWRNPKGISRCCVPFISCVVSLIFTSVVWWEEKGTLPLPMCARKLMRAHSMFDCDFVHQIIVHWVTLSLSLCMYSHGCVYCTHGAKRANESKRQRAKESRVSRCVLVNFYVCLSTTENHWDTQRLCSLAIFIYTQHCERAKTVHKTEYKRRNEQHREG